MSIEELKVNIINGKGGPNQDSIPVYSDKKAPNGGQVFDLFGNQLMLANTEVSGVQYIIVDPKLVTTEMVEGLFFSYKPDGSINYTRLWIFDPDTGKGVDYKEGIEMWVEYSHLQPVETSQLPEPPVQEDVSVLLIDWVSRTVAIKPK